MFLCLTVSSCQAATLNEPAQFGHNPPLSAAALNRTYLLLEHLTNVSRSIAAARCANHRWRSSSSQALLLIHSWLQVLYAQLLLAKSSKRSGVRMLTAAAYWKPLSKFAMAVTNSFWSLY